MVILWLVAAPMVVVAGTAALVVPRAKVVVAPTPTRHAETEPDAEHRMQIPLEPFSVAIWTPPDEPGSPEVTESASAPIQNIDSLELVGLIAEPGAKPENRRYFAAIYDPGADTLHLLRTGDSLGRMLIERVDRSGVLVAGDSGVFHLEMDQWRSTGGDGS